MAEKFILKVRTLQKEMFLLQKLQRQSEKMQSMSVSDYKKASSNLVMQSSLKIQANITTIALTKRFGKKQDISMKREPDNKK